jgi:hypothetical protein
LAADRALKALYYEDEIETLHVAIRKDQDGEREYV